jgi:NAD(P)-dependent dehydrogenase (short-subunit alcohol dehydrogenase family)
LQASFHHAAITGASSGLGAALALELARPGAVLHLAGRDAARLAVAAAAARARGAEVRETVLDVRDAAACAAWIAGAGRLELVVANAGISAGSGGAGEPPDQARAIFETNVMGVMNTAVPALAALRAQPPGADGRRGHLAVIASLAAFLASPGAPAYCASKAAVQRWTEAQAPAEARHGVLLHAVCPGFVRTPMTDRNRFPMPFLMEAEEAARRTLAGIAAGRVRIAYPWPTYALARLGGALPAALLRLLPAKA